MNTPTTKIDPKTIFELSNRTISRIIKRADLACSICSWSQAFGDIHHIQEVELGGSNMMDNLIYVCPNCHRSIHQLGDSFKTKAELKKLSLDITLPNWLDYYNPKRNKIFQINNQKLNSKKCLNITCTNIINYKNKNYCSAECFSKGRSKCEWSKELLLNTLKEFNCNLVKCGDKLHVSDNAFKKQCINFGINIKELKQTFKRLTADQVKI